MRLVSVDTETELKERGCLAPRLACMSYRILGEPTAKLAGRETATTIFRSFLAQPDTIIITHNGPYDAGVLVEHDNSLIDPVFEAYAKGRILCTQTREQLIAIKQGRLKVAQTGLDGLSKHYLGYSLDKGDESWRYRFGELMNVSLRDWPEEAKNYATSDASTTLDVFLKQAERHGISQTMFVSPDELSQKRAAWALYLMGCWGLRTEPDAVAQLKANLEVEHQMYMSRLVDTDVLKVGGTKKNPKISRDIKAIRARVLRAFESTGRPVPTTDPSESAPDGNIQYSDEVLSESGDPVLEILAEAGYGEKLLTTFIPILERGTRIPINPRWNPLVETGRISCSDPNETNQPRKGGVRECYVPRRGSLYSNADFSLAELKSLGQIQLDWFGTSELAKALQQSRDVHLDLGAQILGIPYDEAVRRYEVEDEAVIDARQISKVANFGYPGGLGAGSFVAYAKNYGLKIDEERGREVRRFWFQRWAEMKAYFDVISRLTGDTGPGEMVQHRSGRVRGRVTFTQAANGFFQGLTADGAKDALWEVCRKCYAVPTSKLYGSRPVAFIHDEILCESPEAMAAEACDEMSETMNAAMQKWIPNIPITSDPRLMKRWYKGAKTVRDPSGRLMIYEPKPKTPKAA